MPDPAERHRLGATTVTVTRLGFGAAPIGNLYRAVTDRQADAAVDAAYTSGIRFFDTAPLYGHGLSELRLGRALARYPRKAVVVTTKVGRLLVPDAAGSASESLFAEAPAVHPEFDFSYDGAMRSLEASLDRLGLDRVDVLHVHDPDNHADVALAGAFRALRRLRDQGVIGALGSGMNHPGLLARFVREAGVDCVQLAGRYTLLDQTAMDELLPLCQREGVSVIAAGVFNSGILAHPAAGAYYDYAPASPAVLDRARRLQDVCQSHGATLKAAALQFPLGHPAVATVLTGAQTAAEVEENAALFSSPIPAAVWDDMVTTGLLPADTALPVTPAK